MDKGFNHNSNDNSEEKDLYKLFNDINFDEKAYEEISVELSEFQKNKLKNNLKKQIKGKRNKSRIKYGATAATIALICIIGAAASTGFAKNIPMVNSIIQIVTNKSGVNGEYDRYAQAVNTTVSNNGMSLTINEALCDDSQLVISYTLKSNENIKKLCAKLSMLSLVDNIKLNHSRGIRTSSTNLNFTDNNTCIAVCEMDVEDKKLPNDFDVELNINEICNVKGKWDFKFNVSKKDLVNKTLTFKPNIKVKFPKSQVLVDKVMINPINTTITMKGNYKNGAKDNMGRSIFDYEDWFVLDNNGLELKCKGHGGRTTGGLFSRYDFKYKYKFEGVKEIPKYLTVIPCKLVQDKELHQVKKLMDKCPLELEQGEIGKLIINEIINDKNKATIKYTVHGKFPHYQAQELYIEDESGKQLEIDDYNIIEDKNNSKDFILEAKGLQLGKKYFLCTSNLDNLQIKEEYTFKIPL